MRRAGAAALLAALVAWGAPAAAGPLEDGLAALQAEDYTRALELLRPLADEGVAQAQHALGDMYNRGWGVAANDFEALGWYAVAGRQGIAEAQLGVARMYDMGEGIPQDFVTAYAWAQIAADQETPGAEALRDSIRALLTERERELGDAEAARLWEAFVVPFRD